MSEWKWYIYLTMHCDCILGNVGQQREYQNKTSNRSIISVSWHHALRRDALETGAVLSLCTGLKAALSSTSVIFIPDFQSRCLYYSGKWHVVSGFSKCGAWTSSINIIRGTGERCKFSARSGIRNYRVRSANPCAHVASGGFPLKGEKHCCRAWWAEAKSPTRKTLT